MDLELTNGDITKQPYLDAVVNAANAQLAPGGGVAGRSTNGWTSWETEDGETLDDIER